MKHRNHRVNQGTLASLNRVKARLEYAIEEYLKPEMPLTSIEFNIRQSLHVLKQIRKELLHSGDY